jgi:phosphotransacetylase
VTLSEAQELVNNRTMFGALMVKLGEADALLGGVDKHFPDTIRPALQVIKPRPGLHRVSGLYVVVTRRGDMYFLADCTVNIEPSADDLAEIALCAVQTAKRFDVTRPYFSKHLLQAAAKNWRCRDDRANSDGRMRPRCSIRLAKMRGAGERI